MGLFFNLPADRHPLTSSSLAPPRLSPTAVQFLLYLLTGGSAALVDLSIFAVLNTVYGIQIVPAAVCSFLVAMCENYVLTSLFVYKAPLRAVLLAKFAAFAAMGLVINTGVTVVLNHMLELIPVLARSPIAHYLPVLAKVGGIGIAFVFNFAVNTLVVFKARP